MQTGTATVESSMEIPQKIKSGSKFQPSYPTSGNISEGTQNTNSKEYMHPMFTAVLLTVGRTWKQPKCPSVDEWIKNAVVHLHNEILCSCKKKEILPFTTAWMDLENIMLSEISQSEKDKYHTILL